MSSGPSENSTGEAWDRCGEKLLINFGVGVLGGGAMAFIFKGGKTRLGAVGFGAGVGVGSGYTECQYILQESQKKLVAKFKEDRKNFF